MKQYTIFVAPQTEIPIIEHEKENGYIYGNEFPNISPLEYPEIAKIYLNIEHRHEAEKRWHMLKSDEITPADILKLKKEAEFYINWMISEGLFHTSEDLDLPTKFLACREKYRDIVRKELEDHETRIQEIHQEMDQKTKNEDYILENIRYKESSTRERIHTSFLNYILDENFNVADHTEEFNKLVEQFGKAMANLISLIIKNRTDVIVFLDKSARPYSWLLKEVMTGLDLKLPNIYFMNFGYEKDESYVPDEKERLHISKNTSGRNVLVVDEVSISGRSVQNAVKLLERNSDGGRFVKTAIFDRDNMPFVEEDFITGAFDVDEFQISNYLDEENNEKLLLTDSLRAITYQTLLKIQKERHGLSKDTVILLLQKNAEINNTNRKIRTEFKGLAKAILKRLAPGRNRGKLIRPLYPVNDYQ